MLRIKDVKADIQGDWGCGEEGGTMALELKCEKRAAVYFS